MPKVIINTEKKEDNLTSGDILFWDDNNYMPLMVIENPTSLINKYTLVNLCNGTKTDFNSLNELMLSLAPGCKIMHASKTIIEIRSAE